MCIHHNRLTTHSLGATHHHTCEPLHPLCLPPSSFPLLTPICCLYLWVCFCCFIFHRWMKPDASRTSLVWMLRPQRWVEQHYRNSDRHLYVERAAPQQKSELEDEPKLFCPKVGRTFHCNASALPMGSKTQGVCLEFGIKWALVIYLEQDREVGDKTGAEEV